MSSIDSSTPLLGASYLPEVASKSEKSRVETPKIEKRAKETITTAFAVDSTVIPQLTTVPASKGQEKENYSIIFERTKCAITLPSGKQCPVSINLGTAGSQIPFLPPKIKEQIEDILHSTIERYKNSLNSLSEKTITVIVKPPEKGSTEYSTEIQLMALDRQAKSAHEKVAREQDVKAATQPLPVKPTPLPTVKAIESINEKMREIQEARVRGEKLYLKLTYDADGNLTGSEAVADRSKASKMYEIGEAVNRLLDKANNIISKTFAFDNKDKNDFLSRIQKLSENYADIITNSYSGVGGFFRYAWFRFCDIANIGDARRIEEAHNKFIEMDDKLGEQWSSKSLDPSKVDPLETKTKGLHVKEAQRELPDEVVGFFSSNVDDIVKYLPEPKKQRAKELLINAYKNAIDSEYPRDKLAEIKEKIDETRKKINDAKQLPNQGEFSTQQLISNTENDLNNLKVNVNTAISEDVKIIKVMKEIQRINLNNPEFINDVVADMKNMRGLNDEKISIMRTLIMTAARDNDIIIDYLENFNKENALNLLKNSRVLGDSINMIALPSITKNMKTRKEFKEKLNKELSNKDIEISYHGDEIILSGVVKSKNEKQEAISKTTSFLKKFSSPLFQLKFSASNARGIVIST